MATAAVAAALPRAPLPIEDLRRARAGARLGRTLHYFECVDSTNTVAHRLATEGAEDGTAILAEAQTRGRGRLGRTWISPPRSNLYLSVIVRPHIAPPAAPQLALVAGIAVTETVREWAPTAAVKWPNDVVIEGRKVAGILTEMAARGAFVHFVVIGIGVNLNCSPADFPPPLRQTATALCAAVGTPIDRLAFSARLLARLEQRYEQFLHGGFAPLRPLWDALSCMAGRTVRVDDGARRATGVVLGITADGCLRVRDASGQESEIAAGDVTVVDGYAGATHEA